MSSSFLFIKIRKWAASPPTSPPYLHAARGATEGGTDAPHAAKAGTGTAAGRGGKHAQATTAAARSGRPGGGRESTGNGAPGRGAAHGNGGGGENTRGGKSRPEAATPQTGRQEHKPPAAAPGDAPQPAGQNYTKFVFCISYLIYKITQILYSSGCGLPLGWVAVLLFSCVLRTIVRFLLLKINRGAYMRPYRAIGAPCM